MSLSFGDSTVWASGNLGKVFVGNVPSLENPKRRGENGLSTIVLVLLTDGCLAVVRICFGRSFPSVTMVPFL
jgi:hypothetical protein